MASFWRELVAYVDYKYFAIRRNSRKIREEQKRLLRRNYSPSTEKLIVFLTRGYDTVSGGILATTWHYDASLKLKHVHGAEVLMCTLPGDPPLLRYTKFENQNRIFALSDVLSYFTHTKTLIVHIPEYAVHQFNTKLSGEDRVRLKHIEQLQLNVELQNIKLLPEKNNLEELKKMGRVTCTTGHERYGTRELRDKLGCSVHKLSVNVSPEQYRRRGFEEKDDLLVVSPDIHPRKAAILKLVRQTFPELKVQVVESLTYEAYKNLLEKAKWALTFGEGLDGYFVETIFSGGVAFAIYNSDFFTEDFKRLRTVYGSYDEFSQRICGDMSGLDNETVFHDYQKEQFTTCAKHYDSEVYLRNLELFYKGDYTYP